MGARTWPNLLSALLRGERARHRRHRLGDGRDHGRQRHAGADRRFRDGAAGQGRDARRARRPGRGHAGQRHPGRAAGGGARRRGRRGRHRRRPGPHGEHLHDGRDHRGRGRASPWSSTATGRPRPPAAPPTCSSTSASRSTSARTAWPARSPRPASASASRPASTPACGTPRSPGASWACPTFFNLLGPLTNPARPPRGRGRLLRPADGAGDGRGVRPPRRLGAGDARRGRPGRVHHGRADPGLDGPRRQGRGVRGGRGRPGPAPQRARPTCAAATPRSTPTWPAGCSPASPARSATPCCSTRRPRSPRTAGFPGDFARDAARRHRPGRRGDRLRRRDRPAGPLGGRRARPPRPPSSAAVERQRTRRANAPRCPASRGSVSNDIRVIPPSERERSHPCENANCAASSATAT